MNDGKIIAQGTKEELKQNTNDEITYSFQLTANENLNSALIVEIEGVTRVDINKETFEVTVEQSKDNLSNIIMALTKQGCKIQNMNSKKASLETVFLELTGRSLRD
nr:DUF4162 domain-containing protein [Pseudomonas sp. ISL-88]